MSEKTAYVKLIRGITHTCPDGTKILAKKPAGPFPMSHPTVKYAERNKKKLQVVEQVARKRAPSRRAKGGRGGSRMPSAPAPVERTDVEFGAGIDELMTLTRALLFERNAKFDLEVKVASGVPKKDLAKAIFAAEQDMLREPDEEIDDDDIGDDDGDDTTDDSDDTTDSDAPPRRRKRRRSTPDTDTDSGE